MTTSTNAATTTTKWVGSKLQWEGPRIKTANNRSMPKSQVKTELLLPSSLQQSHKLLEVLEMEEFEVLERRLRSSLRGRQGTDEAANTTTTTTSTAAAAAAAAAMRISSSSSQDKIALSKKKSSSVNVVVDDDESKQKTDGNADLHHLQEHHEIVEFDDDSNWCDEFLSKIRGGHENTTIDNNGNAPPPPMHAATAKYEPTTTFVTSSAAEAEEKEEEEEEAPLVSSSSLVQSFFGFPKPRTNNNNGGNRRGKGVLEGEAKAAKAKHTGRGGGKDGRTGDQSAEKAAKAAKQSQGGGGRGEDKHEEERHRQEDEEDALCNKVEELGAEITSFKRENKRLEKLAKESEENLARLVREKAEWENHKLMDMKAFQVHQEEEMLKLKKERQLLDTRSRAMLGLPTIQRKEVEELKARLATEQTEHHEKEKRWRLTTTRLRQINEDLSKQVQELSDEVKRYEICLLHNWDDQEPPTVEVAHLYMNSQGKAGNKFVTSSTNTAPAADENKNILQTPCNPVGGFGFPEEKHEPSPENSEVLKPVKVPYEVGLLTEQAKLLSQIYSQPDKNNHTIVEKQRRVQLGQFNPNFSNWRRGV
ncbi:unnamed protein product [Sphagnum compactum]